MFRSTSTPPETTLVRGASNLDPASIRKLILNSVEDTSGDSGASTPTSVLNSAKETSPAPVNSIEESSAASADLGPPGKKSRKKKAKDEDVQEHSVLKRGYRRNTKEHETALKTFLEKKHANKLAKLTDMRGEAPNKLARAALSSLKSMHKKNSKNVKKLEIRVMKFEKKVKKVKKQAVLLKEKDRLLEEKDRLLKEQGDRLKDVELGEQKAWVQGFRAAYEE